MNIKIKENIERLKERIAAAAQRSGRQAGEVVICAVTKGASVPQILEAREAGITVFGENRVQEAETKAAQVPGEWHMIGHLQSNKIKPALALFHMIQSVDSLRLAGRLNEELLALNRVLPVLLEVNISGEPQKHGFGPEELYAAVDGLAPLTQLHVNGLMGIAPNVPEDRPKREAFKKLKNLSIVLKGMKKERLEMRMLSMGMSGDFEIAVEEGSNLLRIGRAIFGGKK